MTERLDVAAHTLRRIWPVVAFLCVMGMVLRVTAARGDLWLDEIWSFIIIAKVHTLSDIVVALPYDNNHVLNSLWLKLVGDNAPTLIVRLPAVLFGALCIPVAARVGARYSQTTAIAAALIFTMDYTFVHFGSEARGYSGLILAILVAVDALEARLQDGTRRSLVVFALAVAFGTFSHLIMIEATGVLCAAGCLRIVQTMGWRAVRLHHLYPVVLAAAAGTLPALICFVVSLMTGPLHSGLSSPFSSATFFEGLGGLVRTTVGFSSTPLPVSASEVVLLLGACGSVLLSLVLPPSRRVLPLLGILALPLLDVVFHLPNQAYVRFHLVTGVFLAVFGSEVWGAAWTKGGISRALAVIAALGFLGGQSVQLGRFFESGRGNVSKVAALITQRGPTRLGVLPDVTAGETAAVLRWTAKRQGSNAEISLIPAKTICSTPPDWLLIVHRPDDPADVDDAARLDATACPKRFAIESTFSAYGMSGFAWTLSRIVPGP